MCEFAFHCLLIDLQLLEAFLYEEEARHLRVVHKWFDNQIEELPREMHFVIEFLLAFVLLLEKRFVHMS